MPAINAARPKRTRASSEHRFHGNPKGSTSGGYKRPRMEICFDHDVFPLIVRWAKHNDRSFSAEVRVLVAEALKRRTR